MPDLVLDKQSLKDLNRKLKKLPGRVAKKVIRSAGRKGGNIIRKAVRQEIDARNLKDTGFLRKQIRVKTKAGPTSTLVTIHSGKAYYGMFHEFGTSRHQPKPFFRPGFEKSKREVIRNVGRFIGDGVEKEARKL